MNLLPTKIPPPLLLLMKYGTIHVVKVRIYKEHTETAKNYYYEMKNFKEVMHAVTKCKKVVLEVKNLFG